MNVYCNKGMPTVCFGHASRSDAIGRGHFGAEKQALELLNAYTRVKKKKRLRVARQLTGGGNPS